MFEWIKKMFGGEKQEEQPISQSIGDVPVSMPEPPTETPAESENNPSPESDSFGSNE